MQPQAKTEWTQYACKFFFELNTKIPGNNEIGSKLGILNTISCGSHAWRSKRMFGRRTVCELWNTMTGQFLIMDREQEKQTIMMKKQLRRNP